MFLEYLGCFRQPWRPKKGPEVLDNLLQGKTPLFTQYKSVFKSALTKEGRGYPLYRITRAKEARMETRILEDPYIDYRREHTELWVAGAKRLGMLAAEGDMKAQREIDDGIHDYENPHRLRHAHLALLVWWANAEDAFRVPYLNTKTGVYHEEDAKEYILDVLLARNINEKRYDKGIADSWVAASMLFGVEQTLTTGKMTVRDWQDVFFEGEENLKRRFSEEGVLAGVLDGARVLLSYANEKEREALYEACHAYTILYFPKKRVILQNIIPLHTAFIATYIEASCTLPDGAKHDDDAIERARKDAAASIAKKMHATVETNAYAKRSLEDFYTTFLFADAVERIKGFASDSGVARRLAHREGYCGIRAFPMEADAPARKDAFYRDVLDEARMVRDEDLEQKWLLYHLIPKAIAHFSSHETFSIEGALKDLVLMRSMMLRGVHPFLRGLKVFYQERRVKQEEKLLRAVEEIAGWGRYEPKAKVLSSFLKQFKEYKCSIEYEVLFAIRLTKRYEPVNRVLFKEIGTIIIECIQSAWMVIKKINTVFKRFEKEIMRLPDDDDIKKIVREEQFREIYRLIYRILILNPMTGIFKKMRDFCYIEEVRGIISYYEKLTDFYQISKSHDEVAGIIKNLDALDDYVPDSLLIYAFSPVKVKQTYDPYEALTRVITEKKWTDFLIENNIDTMLPEEIFRAEYSKVKLETESIILIIKGIIDDWSSNREMLFRDIDMRSEERIELLEKNATLLARVMKSLETLLPTPVYFVHAWLLREENERNNEEIAEVKEIVSKNENEMAHRADRIADRLTEIEQAHTARSHDHYEPDEHAYEKDILFMRLALLYNYAASTFQRPLARKMKEQGHLRLLAPYLEKYSIDFKNDIRFVGRIGLFLGVVISVTFGYIAPFITGGNNDFWGYFATISLPSVFLLAFVMALLCKMKIGEIVRKRVGTLARTNVYKRFGKGARENMLLFQGYVLSFFVSTIGLCIYHPLPDEGPDTFFQSVALFIRRIYLFFVEARIPNVPEDLVTVGKYLIAFPFVALFIGLFVENKFANHREK